MITQYSKAQKEMIIRAWKKAALIDSKEIIASPAHIKSLKMKELLLSQNFTVNTALCGKVNC